MPAYSDRSFSATGAKAVTPSDAVRIEPTPAALHIGTAGNLVVEMANGDVVTIPGVAAGMLPIQVVRVLTASTAAGIVAFYN